MLSDDDNGDDCDDAGDIVDCIVLLNVLVWSLMV